MVRKRNTWLVAAGLLSANGGAWALGLGQIEVRSGLNQPLDAEIRLIADAAELATLEVDLAGASDWARVGLDRSRAVTTPLEFSVGKSAAGEDVIKVRSKDPVREPFLSILLEVNWANGRVLREFTVLLDPPVFAPATSSSTAVVSRAIREEPPLRSEEVPYEPVATQPQTTPSTGRPTAIDYAPASRDGSYGPVAAGETLWEVALKTRPSSDTNLNRMMVALLRLNPDAFYENNINALKKGAILRVPTDAELGAIAIAEASSEVQANNAQWNQYRQRASSAAPVVADLPSSDIGRSTLPADRDSRIELVPPRSSDDDQGIADRPGAGTDPSAAQAAAARLDLARAREDLAAREQEVAEVRSRLTELEDIRSKQERLLSIKDDELRALQEQLRLAREAATSGEPIATLAPIDAPLSVDPIDSSDDSSLDDPLADDALASIPADDEQADPLGGEPDDDLWSPDADPLASDDAQSDDPASDDPLLASDDGSTGDDPYAYGDDPQTDPQDQEETSPAQTVGVTPVVPVISAPPAPPSSGLMGQISNPSVLAALGVLGLGLLGFFGWRMTRRSSAPAAATAGGGSLASQLVRPKSDASPAAADTLQDELELRDAVLAEPHNVDYHQALLRHYYEQNDPSKFETAAVEMRQYVSGVNDPAWLEVCELGRVLVPESPLFEAQTDNFDAEGFDNDDFEPSTASSSAATKITPADAFDDFDLPEAGDQASAPPPPTDEFELPELDFEPTAADSSSAAAPVEDSNWVTATIPAVPPEAMAAAKPAEPAKPMEETMDLDFSGLDLDFDQPAADSLSLDNVPSFDLPELESSSDDSFGGPAASDFDDPSANLKGDDLFGDEDTVATKLDLARAYVDMGDPDGARGMLEEVMNEGNDQQKSEARKLLDSL